MRICVIDDQPDRLEHLASTIRAVEPSADVVAFANTDEALSAQDPFAYDVVFISLALPHHKGIAYAQRLRRHNQHANIVFDATSAEHLDDAVGIRSSGFLTQPITAEAVREELDNLRFPVAEKAQPRLRVKCFGNFEAYVDGKPLELKSEQAKEVLAYLVDRKGAKCPVREIEAVLWEGRPHSESQQSHLRHLTNDLKRGLEATGCTDVLMRKYGALWIVAENVDCDYYDYLLKREDARAVFRGEYMSQYSWAERTLASLLAYK